MKRFLKKAWAVLLAAALLISVVPFYAFAVANDLRVWVANDLHLNPRSQLGDLPDDDSGNLYGHATIQGQMSYESTAIIKSFFKTFSASEDEILLLPGDLTNGSRLSHAELIDMLNRLETNGKRVFVINGNHDVKAKSSDDYIDYKEFKQLYDDFGYNEALATDDGSASYTAELYGDYRLITIDSCYDGNDEGRIDDRLMSWIKTQVKTAADDGKYLVAMVHHSVLPHMAGMSVLSSSFFGGSYMDVAETLADLGIKYVFTGHIHANDISEADTKSGNKIYDIMTGSLITYPNAYRQVTFNDTEVIVNTSYVTQIDPSDLVEGYSNAQLHLLQTDFPSFCHGYFNTGIVRWVTRMIGSAQKIAGVLNIDKGSALYGFIDKIMGVLGEALALPLYDETGTQDVDSIQEIAAKANISLPESNYESIYDVAGVIFGGYFAGDEHLIMTDPEPQLFFSALRGCIAFALGQYSEMLLSTDGAKITGLFAKLTYANTPTNRLLSTLVDPFLESIISDAYTPGDLNVTLEAYDVNGSDGEYDAALSLFQMLSRYLNKIIYRAFA